MEIMCCCSCSSMSFCQLQDFPSSMSTKRNRIRSRCNSSLFTPRRLRDGQVESSNVTFVGYGQRRWKLELRSRGLNYTARNPFHIPGWWCPIDRRSQILCCGVKKNCGGDPEEPVGNTTEKVITKDGKFCSSLDTSFNCWEVPIISSREETTSNPSVVSPVQPSRFFSNSSTSRIGVQITAGHFFLAAGALLLVDYHILMTNPQSTVPFRLSLPFLLSAGVTASLGYFFVPVLEYFKAAQVFRIDGPTSHNVVKIGTPTMGGLFFVPVGVVIAGLFTGFKSIEVQAATISTLACAAIGMMDDVLALWRRHNYGLPGRIKLTMQVAVGTSHFFWLEFTRLSYPHSIKYGVWLPAPFGTVHLAKWYLPLTAFCFAAMSNGVNLTDGLDGLAAGSAAVAFIAMSIAMLPLLPALGVFGSSMAGACFGFLVHNRYKAKVFMGDTGSLALGGALAAMACCTGMFFPLFIASGVFVIETVSVISQVLYFKLTKRMYGEGRRLFLMAPLHHHLELLGLKEPIIIIMVYSLSIGLGVLVIYLVLGNGIKVSIH